MSKDCHAFANVPLARHVLNHDTADTHGVGNSLWVLDLVVLVLVLAHDAVHVFANVAEDIVQELDSSLTGAHTEDHAKVDVLHLGGNVRVAHEFDHLEELLAVQVLLRGNDVDHLVKVVLFVTVQKLADIAGQIQGGTVPLSQDGFAQVLASLALDVLGEVDQESSIVFFGKTQLGQLLGGRLHVGLGDLALSRVFVETDVESRIRLLVLFDREVTESLPQGQGLGLAIAHLLEVTAGLLIGALVKECLGL